MPRNYLYTNPIPNSAMTSHGLSPSHAVTKHRSSDQRSTGHDVRYKFTGKERDAETGFDYFGARYYASDLSIWLSVDPLASKFPNMSPYAYVYNNPIMLVDPDGEFPFPIVFALFGLLTYPSIAKAPSLNYNQDAKAMHETKELQNMWLMGTVMGTGYISGAFGTASQVFRGLASQFTVQFSANMIIQIADGNIDFKEAIVSSLKSLDFSDAVINKLNLNLIVSSVAKTMVTISPSEAKLLGVDSETEFTVGFVANLLAGKENSGDYAQIFNKLFSAMTIAIGKALIEDHSVNEAIMQQRNFNSVIDYTSTLGQGVITPRIPQRKPKKRQFYYKPNNNIGR